MSSEVSNESPVVSNDGKIEQPYAVWGYDVSDYGMYS
jgi:hypothetical protein